MFVPARDDDFLLLLKALPREEAPGIPVESLLRRLAWRRARLVALGLLAAVTPLLAFLLLRERPEPPVNLNLKVVDVGAPVEQPTRDPPELNLP